MGWLLIIIFNIYTFFICCILCQYLFVVFCVNIYLLFFGVNIYLLYFCGSVDVYMWMIIWCTMYMRICNIINSIAINLYILFPIMIYLLMLSNRVRVSQPSKIPINFYSMFGVESGLGNVDINITIKKFQKIND